jgi:hypothetical protein
MSGRKLLGPTRYLRDISSSVFFCRNSLRIVFQSINTAEMKIKIRVLTESVLSDVMKQFVQNFPLQ